MIRDDGKAERLLLDNEIGWQAGKWDINCRSVAICIDDDHESDKPEKKILECIASLIRSVYSQVPKERIFGHREINPKTTCPGEGFSSTPKGHGWKEELLGLI